MPTSGPGPATTGHSEVTGLVTAQRYAADMSRAYAQVADQAARFTTGLGERGVDGPAVAAVARAQELTRAAGDAWTAAHGALERQTTVREAYTATPDAGGKAFLTDAGSGTEEATHSAGHADSGPPPTMQVTRQPQYPDFTELGGPNAPGEDYLILVDGKAIGGTYWCGADDIPDGQRWASWGPAGLSLRHPDRESAERIQVREYAVNPDVVDRQIAEQERAAQAERARQAAAAAESAAQRRRDRLGDDAPGPTVWALPSHHVLYGAEQDIATVATWLRAHGIDDADGLHEIRVEQRAHRRVIVFHRTHPWSPTTEAWAVTCTIDPPHVDTTPRPDLVDLLAEHYPTKFPLIDFGRQDACAACTRALTGPVEVTPWPCAIFTAARKLPGPQATSQNDR
jgi:hypothetical protein